MTPTLDLKESFTVQSFYSELKRLISSLEAGTPVTDDERIWLIVLNAGLDNFQDSFYAAEEPQPDTVENWLLFAKNIQISLYSLSDEQGWFFFRTGTPGATVKELLKSEVSSNLLSSTDWDALVSQLENDESNEMFIDGEVYVCNVRF